MKVSKTKTIIIRGKKEKVFKEATEIMERAFPRINESLRTQFLGFEERKDFGGSYLAVFYDRDYDETLRGGKTTGKWISDAQQVFCTGKPWKAVLTIAEWRLKK